MIKVLSYNVYYESMTINRINSCNPIINDTTNNISYTTCLKNVADFINNNGPYDFVGLQEATNWIHIKQISSVLTNMNDVSYKPSVEDIVTFYNKKYTLDDTDNQILGHMEDAGRPMIILFFKQKICVINIHAGHNRDVYKFDSYLLKTLNNSYTASMSTFLNKFKTYNIIMMGDFNDELDNLSSFDILKDPAFGVPNGRKLYGINKKKSCCDDTIAVTGSNLTFAYDHILSTYINNTSNIFIVQIASDHMPIISNISVHQIIGYDFDGVLHKNVGPPDIHGQRHPIKGPYTPFNKIIDQINRNINNGDTVYIITARSNNSKNKNTIKNFLIKTKLPINNIKIIFTAGQNKSTIINNKKVNEFYDDSCLRIVELYNEIQRGNLPNLRQLFLVEPEKDTIVAIDNQNISLLCPKSSIISPPVPPVPTIPTTVPATPVPATPVPIPTVPATPVPIPTVPPVPTTVPTTVPTPVTPSSKSSKITPISQQLNVTQIIELKQDNLLEQLNEIINNMTNLNESNIIDQSAIIINEITKKYNYKFVNPAINIILSDLNKTLNDLIQNNKYTKLFLKYINTLEYESIILMVKELNDIKLPTVKKINIPSYGIRQVTPRIFNNVERIEINMLNTIINLINIIKQDKYIADIFNNILISAPSTLNFRDYEIFNAYKKIGFSDEIIYIIVIFYSALRKIMVRYPFVLH